MFERAGSKEAEGSKDRSDIIMVPNDSGPHMFAIPPGIFTRHRGPPKKILPLKDLFQSVDERRKISLKRKRDALERSPSSSPHQEPDADESDSSDNLSDAVTKSQSSQHVSESDETTRQVAIRTLTSVAADTFPHPSDVINATTGPTVIGGKRGAQLTRQERERRIGLLMTILNRCVQKGDWDRASRAVGVLLRCASELGDMMVQSGQVPGLAAEILMRRRRVSIQNKDGDFGDSQGIREQSGDDVMSEVHPLQIQPTKNEREITAEGLEAAITLYTSLIQWYPVRRTNIAIRFRINWYPTLFALRINLIVLRESLEIDNVSAKTPSARDRNPAAQRVHNANKARKKTLAAIRELSEDAEKALDPPHSFDKDLLTLRGQIAEWEARVVFPAGRVGDGVFNLVRRFEDATEVQREDMLGNLARFASQEVNSGSMMRRSDGGSGSATPRATTHHSINSNENLESSRADSRETSSRHGTTVLSYRTTSLASSGTGSGAISDGRSGTPRGGIYNNSGTPSERTKDSAAPSSSRRTTSSPQPVVSARLTSSSHGPTASRETRSATTSHRSPSPTPSNPSIASDEADDQEWSENIVYMWTRFVSHANKPRTADEDDGLTFSTNVMKSWIRRRRRLLREAEGFHERASNADDEVRRTRGVVRGNSFDE